MNLIYPSVLGAIALLSPADLVKIGGEVSTILGEASPDGEDLRATFFETLRGEILMELSTASESGLYPLSSVEEASWVPATIEELHRQAERRGLSVEVEGS